MRNALSKKIVDIQPSGIRKFFDVVSEIPDAISLGVGEPDFDTPWNVREEGIYALEKGRTFYTSNAGLKELREEICNYVARKYNVEYNPMKETLVTVGGSEAIDIALRCMIDPGDEVIIPQPSYVSYLPCAVMADAVPVFVNLKEENEFKLTKEELLEHITDKTKVLIMPFPNNPTGAIMTRDELMELVPVIIEKDLYVISDEIYSELTYGDNKHCSIASLPGMKERTIMINGFSKAFAMTGWRLGYACGPDYIIKQMIKLHQLGLTAINPLVVPSLFFWASITLVCSGLTSGRIIGTSGVQRLALLLDTTGTSAFAYLSSNAFISSLGILTAQNTKSTFDTISSKSLSISYTDIFLTNSGIGVCIFQRPSTASS